jgi:hypothetical protein
MSIIGDTVEAAINQMIEDGTSEATISLKKTDKETKDALTITFDIKLEVEIGKHKHVGN